MQLETYSLRKHIEALQSSGVYAYTYKKLLEKSGKSYKSAERALSRLKKDGFIVSPVKGFFVTVPMEYRTLGAPPVEWYLHELMTYLEEKYYIGLLSAAEIYGATHHHPQEIQVVCERARKPIHCGRTRIRFFVKRKISENSTASRKTKTGFVQISNQQYTALDLIRYNSELGGLSSVAPVILELHKLITPASLVHAAENYELTVAQRLGFILESNGATALSDRLNSWLLEQRPRLTKLRTDSQAEGSEINQRWKLKVNEELDLEP